MSLFCSLVSIIYPTCCVSYNILITLAPPTFLYVPSQVYISMGKLSVFLCLMIPSEKWFCSCFNTGQIVNYHCLNVKCINLAKIKSAGGRDRMVVGFTTTYVISAYHHWCCELESRPGRGVQHYVIKFVSYWRQVGGFLRVLWFPPPIKLTVMILLKYCWKWR
jgi:hypothetical protein